MLKQAEKYEELLSRLNYRPHPMRLLVLRALCTNNEFTDLHALAELLSSSGVSLEKEKIRMILKRLNECGFLERRGMSGQNKFLFRLKPLAILETEVQSTLNRKHQ